jgi:hypothetical protein
MYSSYALIITKMGSIPKTIERRILISPATAQAIFLRVDDLPENPEAANIDW